MPAKSCTVDKKWYKKPRLLNTAGRVELKRFQIVFDCFCNMYLNVEAGRGAAARGVTVKPTGCGFDPHSRR